MEEPPYRAMPLPPGPPREWRPVVEWGLAVFNGLMLVALLCGAWVPVPPTWFGSLLCMTVALALYGLLSHAPPRRRAFAVLPSALLWFFVAIALPFSAAAPALLCVAAGALTMESAVARMRRP
jgi:hypothetical protein